MKKKISQLHTMVCQECCKSKPEKECNWVSKPDHRFVMCNDCLDVINPVKWVPVIVDKEKVKFVCECGSKKTLIKKDSYTEKDLHCNKCNKDNSYKLI